jgi:hypothetical protein
MMQHRPPLCSMEQLLLAHHEQMQVTQCSGTLFFACHHSPLLQQQHNAIATTA